MERILIIGSPGSGKSTCSKQLHNILQYPILHLDRIFHIDNQTQITREELIKHIEAFISKNKTFIIDGNYTNTLPLRMKYADTIIYFNIDSDICVQHIIERTKPGYPRDDIAPGFDNSILDPNFIQYTMNFKQNNVPKIDKILEKFEGNIIRINNYIELEDFYNSIS